MDLKALTRPVDFRVVEAYPVSHSRHYQFVKLKTLVPEQTAIAGRIQKELRCLPVDNYDFRRIMDIRVKSGKEKSTTGFKSGPIGTEMPADAGKSFESFIVSPRLPAIKTLTPTDSKCITENEQNWQEIAET